MKIKKILLSVKRSQFRCDDPSSDEADNEFISVRKDILERDNYTCQFCNFRATKFQDIHHIDDNHKNNTPENLVTICCLCHACHHLGLSGVMQKGFIIYLDPELNISQAELNQAIRVLWIGEDGENRDVSLASINMLSRIYKATVTARRKIGTSDPTILGDYLLNLDEYRYNNREKPMQGLYFLPSKKGFEKQFEYWKTEVFKGLTSNTWAVIAEQRLKNWSFNETGFDSDSSLAEFIKNK